MIKYIFFPVILVSHLFSGILTHEYYVSLTEITYKPEQQRVEVIARLFHDDFENVLQTRYSKELNLKPSKQSDNIETFIKLYFDKKFTVSIDGVKQTPEYLGYKFDQDRINILLKIKHVNDFKEIAIQNLLLTDVFEEQKNIVHCFKPNQKKSVLLTRFDAEAVLKFN